MELVLKCLDHLPAIGIDANVTGMSVKSKKGLALIGEGRHPVDDRFFCAWHGLFGKSANALKLFAFRGFNCCQIVVYYCHKRIISCEALARVEEFLLPLVAGDRFSLESHQI